MDKDLKQEAIVSSQSPDSLLISLRAQLAQLLSALDEVQHQLSEQSFSTLNASNRSALQQSALQQSVLQQSVLRQQVAHCQPAFREIVARLENLDLSPSVEQRIRPATTEAHRLLRLLSVDAMRLQTAKQPETIEKVRSQLSNQTERLQGFVQVILETLQATDS